MRQIFWFPLKGVHSAGVDNVDNTPCSPIVVPSKCQTCSMTLVVRAGDSMRASSLEMPCEHYFGFSNIWCNRVTTPGLVEYWKPARSFEADEHGIGYELIYLRDACKECYYSVKLRRIGGPDEQSVLLGPCSHLKFVKQLCPVNIVKLFNDGELFPENTKTETVVKQSIQAQTIVICPVCNGGILDENGHCKSCARRRIQIDRAKKMLFG